jgi:hemerythrin
MFYPERKHHRFRALWMEVPDFVRFYVLRHRTRKPIRRPRPAALQSQTGTLWDASLATGIEGIDGPRQQLMVALQRFEEALREGSGLEIVSRTIEQLARYSEEQFKLEESYMARIKYPRLPAHREKHARLRNRIQYLQHRIGNAEPAKALELSRQLCQVLRDHIRKDDAAYVEFARSG